MSNGATLVGVIFERGIKLSRAIDGAFHHQSFPGREKCNTPEEVQSQYGVRPIIEISRGGPALPERSIVLSIEAGKTALDFQYSELDQLAATKHITPLSHNFNTVYLIGAVLYHCRRLAELYSHIAAQFANLGFPRESDHVIFGNQPEPYYELEALITAVIRAYDSTRYILWHSFRAGGGSVPNSFPKTVDKLGKAKNLPRKLAERLDRSWSKFGEKAKEYRDCLQHYCPVGRELPFAHMERLKNSVWAATLWIPDNPEAKSQRLYRYEQRLDALDYGWKLANEILDVTHFLVSAIPSKANGK